MIPSIKKIGIIGAGQMGSGISICSLLAGYSTSLWDSQESAVTRTKGVIARFLEDFYQKKKIDGDQKYLNLLKTPSFSEFADCDLIIEAIQENDVAKKELFKKLEICKPSTIFASNTSSVSLTDLASATQRPTQVIGIHFMNPAPKMQLVEIIRALQTSDQTTECAKILITSFGKTYVESRDTPGFTVNRILIPMINEAIDALFQGIASKEAIDSAMVLGTHQPMGPLKLADFIGLDTCLSILKIMEQGFGNPKYAPSPLLQQYVHAGWLGKKTGRGFYTYESS